MALPLSRAQILGAKIGAYFTLGMIQFFIVFAVGAAAFGMDFGSNPPVLLAVMAAFVLCITALTFALAPWITSEGHARGLVLLLSLSLAPLGGAWWPLEIVPEFMQTLGHLSPVAWAMDAFQDLIWYNGGFADVIPEISSPPGRGGRAICLRHSQLQVRVIGREFPHALLNDCLK